MRMVSPLFMVLVATLEGEPVFADTPRASLARQLVEGGFVTAVSIGIGVEKFDVDNKTITKSKLFEVSLVSVPANPEALIELDKNAEMGDEITKKLKHYDEIHPAFREFTKTFLSTKFCKTINYEKKGNLVLDINRVFKLILENLICYFIFIEPLLVFRYSFPLPWPIVPVSFFLLISPLIVMGRSVLIEP